MTDLGFWKDRQAEFEKYAKEYPAFEARWDVTQVRWWFSDGSMPEHRVDQQCERVFKAVASKAAQGLPRSTAAGDAETWSRWLDSMRECGWGFRVTGNVACTEREWNAGVKDGKALAQIRREQDYTWGDEWKEIPPSRREDPGPSELELEKFWARTGPTPLADSDWAELRALMKAAAADGERRRLRAAEASEEAAKLYHWLENGAIGHVFAASARFCEELSAREIVPEQGSRVDSRRRAGLAAEAQSPAAMDASSGGEAPRRTLKAISDDLDRRANAKKDLERTLKSYLSSLSRARDLDYGRLAEIWGQYAIALYDSLAESFEGLPLTYEAAFGESGILAGGQTLEDVKTALNGVRFSRPKQWPPAETSSDPYDDSETAKAVGELMCSEVSFGWAFDEPLLWSQIKKAVLGRAKEWMESSTNPDVLGAVRNFEQSLKRISPDDPKYREWESFCYRSHEAEARWVSISARRAKQGKSLDPKGVLKFVLRLFDIAVDTQIALVKDTESVAGCETELKTLARGSLDYLENILTQVDQTDQIARWRRQLELELVDRLAQAKLRALAAARGNQLVPSEQEQVVVPQDTAARAEMSAATPQDTVKPSPRSRERKGDTTLLAGKRSVRFETAEEYLGIKDRQRQKLISSGALKVTGQGQNRKITVDSLMAYLPTDIPN